MPRPKCCRQIGGMPGRTCFHPEGSASSPCGEVSLSLDEYEAIRLADLEGLYQEQAAIRMNVSRQTFGRIVETARRKVADVLVHGKTLRIEGGVVSTRGAPQVRCPRCHRALELSHGGLNEPTCPRCRQHV